VTTTMAIVVVLVGLFIAAMLMSLLIAVSPTSLRVTERLVCPRGSHMRVDVVKLSYHRPGERGIVVSCEGADAGNVRAKAVAWLFAMLVLPSVALAAWLVPWLWRTLPR
jgi:hypothetical protein